MRAVGVLAELTKEAWPKTYAGEHLREVRFPIGGIGTGTVSLGGRGELRDWEIFNHPDKGNDLPFVLPLIRTETAQGQVQARVLEARTGPPYESGHGLPVSRLSGVPRLRSCTFAGAYPFACVAFEDRTLPVEVTLEAFNPLVPGEPDASGLPAAVLRYHLHNPKRSAVKVSLAFNLPNPIGPERGRRNEVRKAGAVRGVLMRNPAVPRRDVGFGTIALAVRGGRTSAVPAWCSTSPHGSLNAQAFWHDFKQDGRLDYSPNGRRDPGKAAVCSTLTLKPRETKQVTFFITWHFPNRTPSCCGWSAPEGQADAPVGNYYATRFKDAWAVVEHLGRALPGLEERSRCFTRAVLESTLPAPVIEAALNNVSTLRTNTCFRTSDGAFYGFEGCSDKGGCCFGNCTHVWNYEQTTAFLFPSLARSMRETEFLVSTDERGLMSFRTLLPRGSGGHGYAAADGQMGCLVKLYREWQLCGDTEWLRKVWPAAKRALGFCWIEGGWDADRDGVMEGAQHTTYDSEFYGPNPQCQVWYLGALRAAERMASAVGDGEFATEVRLLFEQGRRWTDQNLFNGEYYVQHVRPADPKRIADGLMLASGVIDPANPTCQVGEGCLADQLVGQYAAHVAGLGYLLEPRHVKKAARSVFRYNRVSMAEHECLGRTYALNDEMGLVVCTWPRGKRPDSLHWFFTEVWTGLEYPAAVLLFYEGCVKEGATLFRESRERYDGLKRNPWNEAECGHHYARAMAAWAGLVALSGFRYSAVTGEMQFLPKVDDDPFRCFWSAGSAWGTVTLQRGKARVSLEVLHGRLELKSLRLPRAFRGARRARANRDAVALALEACEGGVAVRFNGPMTLRAGSRLEVSD